MDGPPTEVAVLHRNALKDVLPLKDALHVQGWDK